MMPVSTAGVAEKNGRFMLALRKPGTSIGERWEFPGGKLEEGETPEEALVREYLEEFHIPVRVGQRLCSGSFRNKGIEYTLLAFSIELLSDNFVLTEHQKIDWFDLKEIKRDSVAWSDRIILDFLLSEE